MESAKIRLSTEELALASDAGMILTKNSVMGKAGEHQIDGARKAVGHAYGGGSQFFAMWLVSNGKP